MTGRKAIWLVARREVVERTRDKSFFISIVVFLGIIGAFVAVPRLFGFGGPYEYRVGTVGAGAEALAAAAAEQAGEEAEVEQSAYPDLAAAEQALADDRLDVVLAGDEIVVRTALGGELQGLLQQASGRQRVYEGFAERGVGADEVTALLNPAPLPVRSLEGVDPGSADASAGFSAVIILVLYGQLIGYGFGVASGIIEEKQTRVVEVLLSTMRPAHLLAGKVLGIGVVGLVQLALQAALGFGLGLAFDLFDPPPGWPGTLAWTLAWFVLGYALFASAFAIVGALCARQEDMQNAATPLSLVLLASLFVAFGANASPTSTLARVGALVPVTAPMVMPVRIVRGVAAPWEIALAVGLILVAIVAAIALAGRVYSGGVLQVASKVKLRQALSAS